jgi:hypothetical protein
MNGRTPHQPATKILLAVLVPLLVTAAVVALLLAG